MTNTIPAGWLASSVDSKSCFGPSISAWESNVLDQETSHLQRQRGALTVICTSTLKSVLGQRNTKSVY